MTTPKQKEAHSLTVKVHTLFTVLENNDVAGGKLEIHTESGEFVGEISGRVSRGPEGTRPYLRTFTSDEPMVVTVVDGESEYELI